MNELISDEFVAKLAEEHYKRFIIRMSVYYMRNNLLEIVPVLNL